jgi:hypothetical protein
MARTQLNLKAVPNVPNLMIADFKTDDGDEMRAIMLDKNTIKIVSADGSLEGFDGITVIGPDITTIALKWPSIGGLWKKVSEAVKETFGSGGCTPHAKSDVTLEGQGSGQKLTVHTEAWCE